MLPITVSEFKAFFTKDFDYGNCGDPEKISDQDIKRAMTEASMSFNERLFDNDEQKKLIFCYLTAYYLTVDINNANSQGAGASVGIVSSRQVRNVSESFAVPDWVKSNPLFSQFAQNGYGLKYLTMIYPYLIGNVGIAFGRTLP